MTAVIGGISALTANLAGLAMVGKINKKLPELERISEIWWTSLFAENSRLHTPATGQSGGTTSSSQWLSCASWCCSEFRFFAGDDFERFSLLPYLVPFRLLLESKRLFF